MNLRAIGGQVYRNLRRAQRTVRFAAERVWRYLRNEPELRFQCNICGATCHAAPAQLHREAVSCARCGSSMRWRALIAALSQELFGKGLAIVDFPVRPDIKGLGLSDDAS